MHTCCWTHARLGVDCLSQEHHFALQCAIGNLEDSVGWVCLTQRHT